MALPRRIEHSGALVNEPRQRSPSCSPSLSPPPPPYSLCNALSPKAAPRRLFSTGSCNLAIGDFLGAVSLLRDLIDEIHNAGRSARERTNLIAELRKLESAILQVEAYYSDIATPAQQMALDQAAHACQYSINDFLATVRKRHAGGSPIDTGNALENMHSDMRWDLATAEDIEIFRCRVSAHVQSVETLLITIQVSSAETARHGEDIQLPDMTQLDLANSSSHSLVLINDSFDTLRKALVEQGSVSQQTLANVDAVRQMMIMNNKQLLSALRQLQKSLPPQVLLQQPVMFTDALNRIAPIHLEWIDSWDAFQAVLQVRFTHLGYNKVKRREFALQDTVTRKELLNTTPIAVCLMPGQKIDMSMIFQDQSERPSNTCPHCQTSCEGLTDSETICTHCGCQFRRIQQQDDQLEAIRDAMSIQSIVNPGSAEVLQKRKRPAESVGGDEVKPCDFKRLRLMRSWRSLKKARVQPIVRPPPYNFYSGEESIYHAGPSPSHQLRPGVRWRPLSPHARGNAGILPPSNISSKPEMTYPALLQPVQREYPSLKADSFAASISELLPPRKQLDSRPEPYIDTSAASISRVTGDLTAYKMQLEGEAPLSQQSLNRADHAYDKSLVTKFGNSKKTATLDSFARHQIGLPRPFRNYHDHRRVEAPPPRPPPRYIGEPAEGHGTDWMWQHDFDKHTRLLPLQMPADQNLSNHGPLPFAFPLSPPSSPPISPLSDYHVFMNSTYEDDIHGSSSFNAGDALTSDQRLYDAPFFTSSYHSSPSLDPVDFIPGPHESILSRIEMPTLNSTTGWSIPGQTATTRDAQN